ncbi:hypothetical protein [Streptomyces ambofaciens]
MTTTRMPDLQSALVGFAPDPCGLSVSFLGTHSLLHREVIRERSRHAPEVQEEISLSGSGSWFALA